LRRRPELRQRPAMANSGSGPLPVETLITRPRLLARMGGAQRIVLVRAPAGWGKTTLLGDWACTRPEPVAWIGLEARHADETSLIEALAVALAAADTAHGGIFESIMASWRGCWAMRPQSADTRIVRGRSRKAGPQAYVR